MKKIQVLLVAVFFLLLSTMAGAAGPVPTFGQQTCSGTAALLWAGQSTSIQARQSVFIQNFSASIYVYIAPSSIITTANAGLYLAPGGGIVVEDRNEGWYCLTSGSLATVGFTIVY